MRTQAYLPYVGLPNILAGEFIVPEFLQDEATPENLSQAVLNLLFDTVVRAAARGALCEAMAGGTAPGQRRAHRRGAAAAARRRAHDGS